MKRTVCLLFVLTAIIANAAPKAKLPKQLQKNGILITNKTYRQIFQAYINRSTPANKCVFITSDSILNAYHVLYEESIGKLEEKQADNLIVLLSELHNKMQMSHIYYPVNDNIHQKTQYHARVILVTALKLLIPDFKQEFKEIEELANLEVKKIDQAQGLSMPKWIGKPSADFAGIDYSIFKVRGFYNKSKKLRQYFKTVKWLQSIPFRVKNDVELASFLLIQQAWRIITHNNESKEKYKRYFDIYDKFLGLQSGLGINSFNDVLPVYDLDKFIKFKQKLLSTKKKDFINDLVHFDNVRNKTITDLRVLPARQTPSAILFACTTNYSQSKQFIPQTLEVAALLGSKFAMEQLSPAVKKIIKQNQYLIQPKKYTRWRIPKQKMTLHLRYLRTLKSLFDTKHKSLPYFMKNKSWDIKTCNTILASWSQMRHTWALQAKSNAAFGCMPKEYVGFVEPSYDFWGKMAGLCEQNILYFKLYDIFKIDSDKNLKDFKKICALLEHNSIREIYTKNPDLEESINMAYWLFDHDDKEKKQKIAKLKKVIKIIETKTLDKHPYTKSILNGCRYDLKQLWTKLQITCLKLQAISLKQLNQIPLVEEDEKFISNYGEILAEIMLYKGNSYFHPRDTSMKIIDVFTSIDNSRLRYLETGIGRPREILVLYPTPTGKVLCKGAVMPYYEFFSAERLNDKQWDKILDDKNKRPEIPAWLKPIVQNGALKVPTISRF